MRRWSLGLPPVNEARVARRPCQRWLNLFVLTHRQDAEGWQRMEWPDGGALIEQSWLVVMVFQIVGSELASIAKERMKRAQSSHR